MFRSPYKAYFLKLTHLNLPFFHNLPDTSNSFDPPSSPDRVDLSELPTLPDPYLFTYFT